MKVYCPAHGYWVLLGDDIELFNEIGPGEIRWKCPECEQEFVIQIKFTPTG